MLDPYSFHLIIDCVLAFDGRLFHSSISNRSGRPVSASATSMATALAEGKPSLLDSHRICQIAENACQDGLILERQRETLGVMPPAASDSHAAATSLDAYK
jgi:hypothetical protein